jgi:nicotinate-nucleotide adenylyltransferase
VTGLPHAPIGVLGGTFNPIHYGHLRLAEELADALALAEVRIIPASIPPHRASPEVKAADRLAMVKLACAGNARLAVDDRECRRSGASYTVDTLLEMRAEIGPHRPICLILGVDAFVALDLWSRWRQLFDLVHLVIGERPGSNMDSTALRDPLTRELETRTCARLSQIYERPAGLILIHPTTPLDISATAIRALIAQGRSPRYLLPDSVLDYIHQHQLYKDLDGG